MDTGLFYNKVWWRLFNKKPPGGYPTRGYRPIVQKSNLAAIPHVATGLFFNKSKMATVPHVATGLVFYNKSKMAAKKKQDGGYPTRGYRPILYIKIKQDGGYPPRGYRPIL